ncbi:MAG: hypothetical protein HPY58_05770 [Firmicutes bacterium]|nr:hypothetical protein [Bacillota bacterium]
MRGVMKQERGSTFVFALLALALLAVLGLGLATVTLGESRATYQSVGKTKARYAAEAGVNRAIFEIRKYLETGVPPAPSYQDSLGPGLDYEVSINPVANTNIFTITASGTHRNFSKEIRVKVDTLPEAADYAIFTDEDLRLGTLARCTIKGDIHSNGKIEAASVASFNLEGEAEAVNAGSSRIKGHPVKQAESIPFPYLDWDRIRSRADWINPVTLDLSILGYSILKLWIVPYLNGQTAYFTDDVILIGPFVGRGVIAAEKNVYVLLSGETFTPNPNEGIMLAARKNIIFLANIADLGNLLRSLAGFLGDLPLIGDLLDTIINNLLKAVLNLVGIKDHPDIYLNGLLYAEQNITGVLNVLTVKGAVIAGSMGNLDLSLDVEHDPELALKLPVRKIFFKDNPVRVISWEEN